MRRFLSDAVWVPAPPKLVPVSSVQFSKGQYPGLSVMCHGHGMVPESLSQAYVSLPCTTGIRFTIKRLNRRICRMGTSNCSLLWLLHGRDQLPLFLSSGNGTVPAGDPGPFKKDTLRTDDCLCPNRKRALSTICRKPPRLVHPGCYY